MKAHALSEASIEEYGITNVKESTLTPFILRHVMREVRATPLDTAVATNEAFETIFGGNAYHLTSDVMVEVLGTMYHALDERQKRPCFFDVCELPLFIVEGPKYSGKSLLTKQLVEEQHFGCFSDSMLIERALAAAAQELETVSFVEAETSTGESPKKKPSAHNDWVLAGRRVHDVLYKGGAVDIALLSELFRLQLQDAQGPECQGLVMDSVFHRPHEYEVVEGVLLPETRHPYEAVYERWLRSKEEERLRAAERVEEGEAERDEPAQTVPASADGEHAAPATSLWQVERVKFGEQVKKEIKPKAPRKGVDLSQLPPPVLPKVEDVESLIQGEKEFIAKAERELEPYGALFSSILYIQCNPQEIFTRFAGLRMDRETGEEYHMVYAPPPPERMPFLLNVDRTRANTAQLHDIVLQQERQWRTMIQWLRQHRGIMNVVHEIDGNKDMAAVEAEANELVGTALASFEIGKKLYHTMKASEVRIADLQRQTREQAAAREAERCRLIAIYTEKGVPLPAELEPHEEEEPFCRMPGELPDLLLKRVEEFSTPYESQYAWSWEQLDELTHLLLRYKTFTTGQLTQFWEQPDEKQEVLDRFVRRFNELPNSVRSNLSCKEELHVYTDDLADSLFFCVQSRRTQCTALIERITKKDIFVDEWETNVCNVGLSLAQMEQERFWLMCNVALQYFSALVDEPLALEEISGEVELMKSANARAEALGADAAPSRTAKPKTVAGKRNHARADDQPEKGAEDIFTEWMTRLTASLTNLFERVKMSTDVNNSKAIKKAAVTVSAQKVAFVATKAMPVIEQELAVALGRLEKVSSFVHRFLNDSQSYVQHLKSTLHAEAQGIFTKDASAVNTALYTIRSCIEVEKHCPPMHLGCGTFAIHERGDSAGAHPPSPTMDPSFITDVPLFQDVAAPPTLIHGTLSSRRLMDLIHLFWTVAPDYALCRADFLHLVQQSDFGGAAAPNMTLFSVEQLFTAFDVHRKGIIDWRELVVHLLFFCVSTSQAGAATSAFYVPEVTVPQLLETRENLGWDPLTDTDFFDIPFYFDQCMSNERLEAYTKALWATFAHRTTGLLNPSELLWFLCADAQPLRGVQKAFHLFSLPEAPGRLTLEQLFSVFHMKATNTVGDADPFTRANLQRLFEDRETISFNEMCSLVLGRKMLNCASMLRRKRFVTDA
ncbi:hypothetical protein STCU_08364 [Strigomonas culicis]|uniref:EF-hand domain-containing protein n=1 Tax=Strigomonas culicis TaxID=28005 RepID=S9VG07_9TRYP|nr:hypothetical protein STCU_08364 [Strigomonas culicis]|eukprot:EPY22070.1 hypothetical protein STCU_08364 [Strigomonas culicis]